MRRARPIEECPCAPERPRGVARTNAVVERTIAIVFAFGAFAGLYPRFGSGGFVTGLVALALALVGTVVARTALERKAGASTAAVATGAIGGAASAVLPALLHAAEVPTDPRTSGALVLRFLGTCVLACPIGVIVGVLYTLTVLPLLARSHEVRDGSQVGHHRAVEACGVALVGLPGLALALSWLLHRLDGEALGGEVLVGAALLGSTGVCLAGLARRRRRRLVAWVAAVAAGRVAGLRVRPTNTADALSGLPVLDGDGAVIVRRDEAYRSRSELHARVRRA